MANDAYFAVAGYVATQPRAGRTKSGAPFLFMRVAWTPRAINKSTGEWTDQQTSFVSVMCYRKIAENAKRCLRRGDPVTLRGTVQVREYADHAGVKRFSVDVVADSLGHDMSRGLSQYSKASQHGAQTAEEYEWSTTAERTPLPGDVAARLASEQGPGGSHPSRCAQPPGVDGGSGDPEELTPGWTAEAPLVPADDADDMPDPADLDDEPDPSDLADEPDPADLAGEQPAADLAGRHV
jgi:single-strand DNA-binding protein